MSLEVGTGVVPMTDKRLVFYLGGFAPVGGIETFVHDLALALADGFPARELVYWGARPTKLPLLAEMIASGVRLTRSFLKVGCRWNLPDYLLQWWAGSCVTRADLLVFKKPPPLRILRRLRRIAAQHGNNPPLVMIAPYRPAEYWGESSGLECFELFDAIVVQDERSVEDLRRAGYQGHIAQIPYLPPHVAPLVGFPSVAIGQPIILGFLGRLERQKNLGCLLRCYQRLTQIPSTGLYELHFFGDGTEKEKLISQVAALHLSNVHFHGQLARGQINAAIDSCHCFLNTSIMEGQCLAALEVLNRGRPFVTTAVGSLPDVLIEPVLGRLVQQDDPETFATAVAEVASGIRTAQITPPRVFATYHKRFDRRFIAAAYITLFNELLGEGRPGIAVREMDATHTTRI